jgi:hypothetical protein
VAAAITEKILTRNRRKKTDRDRTKRGAVVIDWVSFRQRSTAVSPLGDDGGRCSNEIDQARRGRRWVGSRGRT